MIIFFGMILILAFIGCKPIFRKEFYSDYAGIEQTRSINGIFILMILLSHTFAKASSSGILDDLYAPIRTFGGQFVVVPFLFYSGYGIMESLLQKSAYIKQFPRKRFAKLFFQFSIITVVYIVVHLILGNYHSIGTYLLSFTGLTSIGNGGWYMFSTFSFYIFVIISFNIFKHHKILAAVGVTVCLSALTIVEMLLDFPSYYFSTMIFLAVGMFYAILKKPFDNIAMKNNITWFLALLISTAGFIFLKELVEKSILFYPIWCGFGMLMILFITMKIRIQNRILLWLGKTTFFIFTLQGIPQLLFPKLISNNIQYYILTIVSTIALALLADTLFTKWDQLFLKTKK